MTGKIHSGDYHEMAKNSAWVMLSNISMVLVLALTIIAARYLGDEAFGQYVFLVAVTTLLNELSVLGTTDYAPIIVAREPDRTEHIVACVLLLRIPLVILFFFSSLFVTWLAMPTAMLVCGFVAADWLIRSILHLLRGVFRFKNLFALDAKTVTLERVAVLICGATPLFLGCGLLEFCAGLFVGRLIGLVIAAVAYVRRVGNIKLKFDRTEWSRLLVMGAPIGLRSLLNMASFRFDAVMLGFLTAASEVGYYGAAFKFLEAGFIFREAIGGAVHPAIARAFGQANTAMVADLYGRAFKVLLVIGGFLAALLYAYSEITIRILFGVDFIDAAPALALLVWVMVPVFGSTASLALFDSVDSGHKTVIPFAIAAFINVCLNAMLIPRYGAVGAAWATMVTQGMTTIILVSMSFRIGYGFPTNWIAGPLLASFIMAISIQLLSRFELHWYGLALGILLYGILIRTTATFDHIDRNYAEFLIGKLSWKRENHNSRKKTKNRP